MICAETIYIPKFEYTLLNKVQHSRANTIHHLTSRRLSSGQSNVDGCKGQGLAITRLSFEV